MLKIIKSIIFSITLAIISLSNAASVNAEPNKALADKSHMKFGFIFAMKEEAQALHALNIPINWEDYKGFKIAKFKYKDHDCVAILSGVGKSMSAGAVTLLIDKFSPDAILNVGTAGGINCDVGDIILSNRAIFHDVNLSSIHLPKYQLPDQPIVFQSKHDLRKIFDIKNHVSKNIHIRDGIIMSSDQFMHRAEYFKEMLKTVPEAKASEMEAASIGAISNKMGCDYLFIKKISNRADDNTDNRFSTEVLNFEDKVGEILLAILNQ